MYKIVSSVKRDYIGNMGNQGKRIDGRTLEQFRDVSVKVGPIQSANGSAEVKMGNTRVMVGVKIQHAEPFPDTPDSGVLMVNAELRPLASPSFELGPPREESIELARVVDRGIRESETISLDKLGITPGEDVWAVFVDIHILDHDGNLIDASALGTIAAILNAKPPEDEKWTLKGFPVQKRPISVTIVKIGDNLMVDPCLDEENVMDARLTVATTEDGNICAMQKGGSSGFSREQVKQACDLARAKAAELRKHLG